DDLVIAELLEDELLADPRAERGDHRLDLRIAQGAVQPGLLHVEDLAAQRQDRLRVRVASLRRGTAGGVALDDEDLGDRGILRLAVLELARHPAGLQESLAAGRLPRLAGREPG